MGMSEHRPQGVAVPLETPARPIDPGVTIGHVHHLGFNTWKSRDGGPQPDGVAGLHHVAIRYPTRAGLADALRRLRAADWPIRQASDYGTHEAIYLSDPDGNDLELCWDRPFEVWPRDALGHVEGVFGDLDLDALAAEAA